MTQSDEIVADHDLAKSGALDITNDMSDAGMEAYCREERFDDFGITDNQPECIEAAYRAMLNISPAIATIRTFLANRDAARDAEVAELREAATALADQAHENMVMNRASPIGKQIDDVCAALTKLERTS